VWRTQELRQRQEDQGSIEDLDGCEQMLALLEVEVKRFAVL